MDRLRAAVIGVGSHGSHHAEKYAALAGVDLIGVVDSDAERAREVARRTGAEAYGNYREVLGSVDLVSVTTPAPSHFPIARDCLRAGVHTLVEKPMAQTVAEAEALIAIAHEHHAVLQPGHVERFNPAVQGMRPKLNEPHFIEAHRLAPFNVRGTDVDVLLDLMIHDIELVSSLIARPVTKIEAVGVPVLTHNTDIANARLEFDNGCVANLTASRVSDRRFRKIRLFQQDAYLSVDLVEHEVAVHRKRARAVGMAHTDALQVERLSCGHNDPLQEEIRAFVNAVRTGTPPVVSGEDGKRALELVLAVKDVIARSPHLGLVQGDEAVGTVSARG